MTPTIIESVQHYRKLSLSLDLKHYILDSIFDYTYFNSKKIAKDYIKNVLHLDLKPTLNDKDRKFLNHHTHSISHFLGILKLSGYIKRYNSKQFIKIDLMSHVI